MPNLRSNARGFNNTFSRLCGTIRGFISDKVSADTLSRGRDFAKQLDAHFKKVEEAFEKLCATEPDDLAALTATLGEAHEAFIATNSILASHIHDVEATIAAASATAANASITDINVSLSGSGDSPSGRMVEKSLKPFILMKSHSPRDLRRWLLQFDQYFHSGKLPQQSIAFKRSFFDRCIDKELLEDISEYLAPTTDIMGPEGCISILVDRFRILYPTFNRRIELFHVRKLPGEDSSQFLTRILALGISRIWSFSAHVKP